MSPSMHLVPARREITRIGVLVPARDEAAHLRRCLESISRAAEAVPVPVDVVVVLDRCTDDSGAIVDGLVGAVSMRLRGLASAAGSVGAARRAGAAALLAVGRPEELWLASTDADSVVPEHWLSRQLAHAAAGAGLVAGTVEVADWSGWPHGTRRSYELRYARHVELEGHGHVHGANLGLRGDVYTAIGGFAAVPQDEDVDLIRRARRYRVPVTWALDLAVTTSARADGRAPRGFAGYLNELTVPRDRLSIETV